MNRAQMIKELVSYFTESAVISKRFINPSIWFDFELQHMYNIHIKKTTLKYDDNLDDVSKGILYNVLGQFYWNDIDESIKYTNKSADLGNKSGIYHKAMYLWIYYKDYKQSFHYYKLSADLGFPLACRDVGECYYKGTGVDKDINLAAEYYAKYLHGIQEGEIISLTEDHVIPLLLYPKVVEKLMFFKYENYKKYVKISNKLKDFIPIEGLREIILSYY
jgi:hypothetical protein